MASPVDQPSLINRFSIHLVIASMALLVVVGLVMLASTGVYATDGTGENYSGLKHQIVYVVLGLLVCVAFSLVDYHLWQRHVWVLFAGVTVLLVLCFVPGIGMRINGEARWISGREFGMPWLRAQPSEAAKIVVMAFLGWWYARNGGFRHRLFRGFFIPLAVVAVPFFLILFEKDLGSAVTIGIVTLAVLFIAGVRWSYLFGVGAAGFTALAALVYQMPNRMGRVVALLDLEAHRADVGLQQWRALLALGSGGLFGHGLGNGREKMFYMPFAHTDFIFPMIGEELGLAGTLSVVILFVVFVIFGMLVAMNAPDDFGRIFGAGIVVLVAVQAAMNIGVTTAVLPNTGLPLPFVSYGGSSLVCTMAIVGILINIYRQGQNPDRMPTMRVRRARVTPRL